MAAIVEHSRLIQRPDGKWSAMPGGQAFPWQTISTLWRRRGWININGNVATWRRRDEKEATHAG